MRRVVQPGIDAVRANWRPFLLIQSLAVLILIAYYTLEPVRTAGLWLAEIKAKGGIAFAALSVAFAAVILPEVARRITKTPRDKPFTIADFGFQLAYFAWLGIVLDFMYTQLGVWFGTEPTFAVVAVKIAADLLIFTAILNMPLVVVLFAWRDADFKGRGALALLENGGFISRYVPLVIGCWAFWFPVVACMYSLPMGLQFVFAVLAEAAWCLLLVHLASRSQPTKLSDA